MRSPWVYMRLRRFVIPAMLALSFAFSPARSLAKPKLRTADPEWEKLQAIYHAAETNMEAGFWADALVRLDTLLKKGVDTASVRYYRGLCNANLKNWVESYDDFGRALAMGDSSVPDDAYVAKESHAKMAEVRKHLGWLLVSAGPQRAGERAILLLDGRPVEAERDPNNATDGPYFVWRPIAVTRGEHTVEVRVEGREPLRKTVTVEGDGEDATRSFAALGPLTKVSLVRPDAATPSGAIRPSPAAEKTLLPRPTDRISLRLGSAGLALGATSVGLFAAHFLDRSDGRGDPLLVAGVVTGGAALLTGVAALLFDGSGSDGKTARRGQKAPSGLLGGRAHLVPTSQGVGLVW